MGTDQPHESESIREKKQKKIRPGNLFFRVVSILYFITWAFGVPTLYSDVAEGPLNTTQTHVQMMRRTAESYEPILKDKYASQEDVNSYLSEMIRLGKSPRAYAHFDLAMPILPFLILSKHESVRGGLAGTGGLFIYCWPFKVEYQIWGWIA